MGILTRDGWSSSPEILGQPHEVIGQSLLVIFGQPYPIRKAPQYLHATSLAPDAAAPPMALAVTHDVIIFPGLCFLAWFSPMTP